MPLNDSLRNMAQKADKRKSHGEGVIYKNSYCRYCSADPHDLRTLIIEKYPFRIPFFLGGGIGLENIDLVKQIRNPYLYALDANSRLEGSPGLKDPEKVKLFRRKFDKL